MKTKVSVGLIGVLASVSSLASSDGFGPEDLLEATRVSIQAFREANSGHSEHFTGFKSWKAGADAKVRIYVNHGGSTMDFNFTCGKHGDLIHCSAN